MANKDVVNQEDINNNSKTRRTSDLLPGYHRTDKNIKFLASTLDQFIQEPQLERLSGFLGSKLSPNYNPSVDTYIDGGSVLRNAYQLEPSMVIRDDSGNIQRASSYDDLINQLKFSGANVDNLDRLLRPSSVSYDPGIDWDKFVNFRQYYWMPTGPDAIEISGEEHAISSVLTVTDSADGKNLIFATEGSTVSETNPLLTFYRGSTYTFNVNSKFPFYIKTAYVRGAQNLYANAVGQGTTQVTIVIDDFTPDVLFYFAEGNDYAIGTIDVKRLTENTSLDVAAEILGKQTYTSASGVVFSNGMKIRLIGNVSPITYQNKEFIIEGVGTAITLVDYDTLKVLGTSTTNLDVNFDATPFDQYPFDDFAFIPLTPEYVTINRASSDKNGWSRYNRWVHQDVIAATARANKVDPVYLVDMRASRPIIEFVAGLQLYNFGTVAKDNIDLIDTTTKNAFSIFEKSPGFYIDGVAVEQGYRVIFNADTDPLVRGKIYVVNFVTINGSRTVALEEATDGEPALQNGIVSTRGTQFSGVNWWFNGDTWVFGQQKTVLNQAPLFDLFDDNGVSFADTSVYDSSFKGTQIFGYAVGTGNADSVLGFPLSYRNVSNVGDYLFDNYFTSDTFTNVSGNTLSTITVAGNYLKVNTLNDFHYRDVWVDSIDQQIPIIQYQVIDSEINYIQIIAVDNPGYLADLTEAVFINDVKQIHNVDYIIQRENNNAFVVSTTKFSVNDKVLIKLYTSAIPNGNGYYEIPINLSNNPLNGPISNFTFTEISDHVKTIVDNNSKFSGIYPGIGNLRDLPDLSSYGTRLVSHKNPIGFAQYFLGSKQNGLIDSVRTAAFDYTQFKFNLIKKISEIKTLSTPSNMLDQALASLNVNKDSTISYNYSDMLAFGNNHSDRTYTVSSVRNTQFSIESVFNSAVLSERALLVYHNHFLLTKDADYTIDPSSARIIITVPLSKGDIIKISDYPSTVGSFVPPTPSKLGLYPKFKPEIYSDDTYSSGPRNVIRGHDGSITVAYNDFRDTILLEFETRVYNNIKVEYKQDLLDIRSILPGAFRNTMYDPSVINDIITPDFLNWVGFFGVDYRTNDVFDPLNAFTFNYSSDVDTLKNRKLPGYWRAIFQYFYDTDKPHTAPWEMLGFTEQPSWWNAVYGPAPYTSGNLILWQDLEAGRTAQGPTAGINLNYARPGLSSIIPVDDMGNLLDPTSIGLASAPIIEPNDSTRVINLRSVTISDDWKIGDQGPAETSWRRSSYWPFVCQIIMALTKPATYAASMFDPARMTVNRFGQYKYGMSEQFLTLNNLILYRDVVNGVRQLSSGYSVYVIEHGLTKNTNYLTSVKTDLTNLNYNLMTKLGGFASKEKLQVTIDAIDPTSPQNGVLIPSEDYQIFFNQSTPVESVAISGVIIQKTSSGYSVRGYDKFQPYFTVLKPFPSNSDVMETVGGRSESFSTWKPNSPYTAGQVVFYSDRYYRVLQTHLSESVFTPSYYQSLPFLPQIGGAQVSRRTVFDSTETIIPYGVEYNGIQEVYDLIQGYGRWLVSKGFVFDEFITELSQVSDWNFTAREFLYWTTQNWATNSVITLSPFSNSLEFYNAFGVVDNIRNGFYEYNLLRANGSPYPLNSFSITRLDGTFKITTMNTTEGLFFARLNVVQKEHAIIFNNYTLFNDVIYDIGSGYRQRRVNLKGFRTANWNGDFFSPGFVFDQANVVDWQQYSPYSIGQVVRFSGNYYVASTSLPGANTFDFASWVLLNNKPTPQLYPNFDYKINQFEDFYSLDIDNFDSAQQSMAQHLIGYTPRPWLNNIIGDATAQYKFYQGYIKEKGTKNPLIKLSKSSLNNWQSSIDFNEEWAFRIGNYGGFNTHQELEIALDSSNFVENPQIIEFVEAIPAGATNAIYYKNPSSILLFSADFDINNVFQSSTVTNFELPVAGYVRYDDIYATAFNKNSILDIANNSQLHEGSVIWLGYAPNNDWDVLRYSKVPAIINAVGEVTPYQTIQFTTDTPHGLSVDDLISVSRIDTSIDSCYLVKEVLSPTDFTVYSSLGALPILNDTITGLLFVFKSSRIPVFEDLYTVPYLEKFKFGDLLWVDSDSNGNWTVYKKFDNYGIQTYSMGTNNSAQKFGSSIAAAGNYVVVSSPNYLEEISRLHGRVFLLSRETRTSTPNIVLSYSINDPSDVYYISTSTNDFGHSLVFDDVANLIIAGAPLTSNIKHSNTNTVVDTTSTATGFLNQGLVKLSLIDMSGYVETDKVVITTPVPENAARFGTSIAYSTVTNKMIVGAPGANSGLGSVYSYTVNASTQTVDVLYQGPTTSTSIQTMYYGSAITGNSTLSRWAVSAPGYSDTNFGSLGAIYVYDEGTSTVQVITGEDISIPVSFGLTETFGSTVKMTSDGLYLIVGSPYANDPLRTVGSGIVDVFIWDQNTYSYNWHQRLHSPANDMNTNFGFKISLDESGTQLSVTLTGAANPLDVTFDTYLDGTNTRYQNNPTSGTRNKTTTFDSGSTSITHAISDAGSAYVYQRVGTHYAFVQELKTDSITDSSTYGYDVALTEGSIYVGAPAITDSIHAGEIFIFDKANVTDIGWEAYRTEEPLIDLSLIKNAVTIDTTTEQLQDYLDIIDPVKGKILGVAEQELRFKTSFDPAIYGIGITGVNTDQNTQWLDSHVGELWWDLSTVKYVWYEQGDSEYRKNNWNGIFPGCTIDVYEWVSTSYLPSEWSVLADTPAGLTQGISGQPKFSDNTVMSVKQVYSTVSNSFTNRYYYWVKNKNTIPTAIPNRKITAYSVATQIADPIGSGNKILALLSPTTMMMVNTKTSLLTDQVVLNITSDTITNAANKHTEWLLLQENDPNSKPNALLEKKLFDSLLGHDSIGNAVPDPTLSSRNRYGIEIRPRQSMFVDRKEALRNVIEFTNSVLQNELVTSQYDFANLETTDVIPDASTYDVSVVDIYSLDLISTTNLSPAVLSAEVNSDGQISAVDIINPGFGYITPPTIVVNGSGTGAVLTASINLQGQVTGVEITNNGSGYTPTTDKLLPLNVRAFTVVVQTDSTANGKWSIYNWDSVYKKWNRIRTQEFDTTNYWKYVDWKSDTFNELVPIAVTVSSVYELNEQFVLPVGSYVKVLNGGDNRYIILRKTESGGTFDNNWDVVYSQNGTIQFLDTLWNPDTNFYSWDSYAGFDQTEFDYSADKELFYILTAIRDDLFVGKNKIYWNQLFFKAVRYAFSEQKTLDWAFKTTFISVNNSLGSLDQRHTYKLQNSVNYEQFLQEIKPYHTKIRRFTESYTSTELTQSFTTDFDLPTYYNTVTNTFDTVDFGDPKLLQYPWKSWMDNHAFGVESIIVYDSGSGYTIVPSVSIVTVPGDTGYGATAVAYISLGKIIKIEVTNPGSGYTVAPTILINGGGGLATASSTSTVGQLQSARAYARLGGSPVRISNITMKFDRVSKEREIGLPNFDTTDNTLYKDTFTCDGSADKFTLTWVPIADKSLIEVTVNGVLQLIDTFDVKFSEASYNPQSNTIYTKKYAILSMNFIPAKYDVLEVIYPKNQSLYNALDRIQDYYSPVSGMPGNDPSQLMTGMEYSGLQIDTLPFNSAGGWDVMPYDSSSWDNYSLAEGYTSFVTTLTSTQVFSITDVVISTGTQVNTYLNGVRIDGTTSAAPVQTLIGIGTAAVSDIIINSPGAGYIINQVTATISAPNNTHGIQATAGVVLDNGAISEINVINPGSGYTELPVITITGGSTLQAYATVVLKSEFTTTISSSKQTNVVIAGTAFTSTNTLVEFRYSTDDGTLQITDLDVLDSVITGGDMAYTVATGTATNEIIFDGGSSATRDITGMTDDGFLNPINSYAPEECVPGQVREALGITVYTEPQFSTPIIVNKKYYVNGVPGTYALGITPTTKSSVIPVFANRKLNPSEFTVDYTNNTFRFASNSSQTGWLSLTSMQLGGISIIDSYTAIATTTGTVYTAPTLYTDIGSTGTSSYVTINGIPATLGVDYTLAPANARNKRAQFTFNSSGTIQAYLFSAPVKAFSEVTEQITVATAGQLNIPLQNAPGNLAPFHSQVIVTVLRGGITTRLNPPVTTYYQVSNGQTVFDLSQSIVYPSKSIGLDSLEVYVNGIRSPIPGIWKLQQQTNQIKFGRNTLSEGDVIAIVVKKDFDYLIENSQLVLKTPAQNNDEYHITTFTNHDPDFIRTERFKGNMTGEYRMQRPILSSAYVWVTYNGIPLSPDVDYTLDTEGYAVNINRSLPYSPTGTSPNDDIVITSFIGNDTKLTAYRIFRDMLGRTHYKRLSKINSTMLTQPVYSTSTTIVVDDASVLTPPDTVINRPGVVLVSGERIEFFTVTGNVLGQLRRSTLGTAPRDTGYPVGTPIVDQGQLQTIPLTEFIQTTSTIITTSTQVNFDLSGIDFNTDAAFSDQIEVRYAGRPLLKPGLTTIAHNPDISYDSSTISDSILTSEFTVSTSSVLTLNFEPQSGARLDVVSRKSTVFTEKAIEFIQERAAALPDKYRYGQ